MWLSELTLQAIGFRVAGLILVVAVQGVVLAAVARALGDPGPAQDGRLALSPAAHVDPAGAVAWVLFGLGWGRALAIDPGRFRHPMAGAGLIVAAGVAAPLALAAVLFALVGPVLGQMAGTSGLGLAALLRSVGEQAIWLALLSLVPVPPLTAGVLPAAAGIVPGRRARVVLVVLILALIASGLMRDLLAPAHDALATLLRGG
ncbi:MAG: hypothetical protein RL123_960 [Pseudomonadota bacterium]